MKRRFIKKAGVLLLAVIFLVSFQPVAGISQAQSEVTECPNEQLIFNPVTNSCECGPCYTMVNGVCTACVDLDKDCDNNGRCIDRVVVAPSRTVVITDDVPDADVDEVCADVDAVPVDSDGDVNWAELGLVGATAVAIAAVANNLRHKGKDRDRKIDDMLKKINKKKNKTDGDNKKIRKLQNAKNKNKKIIDKAGNKGKTNRDNLRNKGKQQLQKNKQIKQQHLQQQKQLHQQRIKAEQQKQHEQRKQREHSQGVKPHQQKPQQHVKPSTGTHKTGGQKVRQGGHRSGGHSIGHGRSGHGSGMRRSGGGHRGGGGMRRGGGRRR